LRLAAGMRPVTVRRRIAGSFPVAFRRVEALTVTGAVFAGIGALLFVAGILITRGNRRFVRGAGRAPGHITGVRWKPIGGPADTTMTGFPELRFTLPDGRVVETVSRSGTTLQTMQEGKAVTVLYDPADPAEAQVGKGASTMVGVALMAIGGIAVLLGAALVAAGIALEDALPESVIRP